MALAPWCGSSREDDGIAHSSESDSGKPMVLTLAIVFALFLPWPWNLVAVVTGIIAEIGEIVWGRRLARRWRPKTGAEAMIGATAEVASPCRPKGQVRVHGELWEAMCSEGADIGEEVRIRRLDGLTLVVEPIRPRDGRAPQS